MKRLPKQPQVPQGVKYALTVPQSVLFADLSLQGNKRQVFKAMLGIDYEPAYIAIDEGGAMRWNYDHDKDFEAALIGAGSKVDAIELFIGLMERTGYALDKVSKRLESSGSVTDLPAYWQAYERHMTSLFTFWNVEHILSELLISKLRHAGRQNDIDDGLARYLKPDRQNYFVKERIDLKKITQTFKVDPLMNSKKAPQVLIKALEMHRDAYEFLLSPFNLDSPLSTEDLLNRAKEFSNKPLPKTERRDTFEDLAPDLRRLALLARRFAFWKNERLDLFALSDYRLKRPYREAAKLLSLQPNELFAMTREEIGESLKIGKPVVAENELKQRQKSYCLILAGGTVAFYESGAASNLQAAVFRPELKGVGASKGLAKGNVRLIKSLKDAKELKEAEIIVTAMTRPEMSAALDRAAAFVTDEGGLLCHAAIISREMKKPCVIATGNATKVLKDGQEIEVDGLRGTVRII